MWSSPFMTNCELTGGADSYHWRFDHTERFNVSKQSAKRTVYPAPAIGPGVAAGAHPVGGGGGGGSGSSHGAVAILITVAFDACPTLLILTR
jgi:hypothetical protein